MSFGEADSMSAHLAAELVSWPTKDRMATILRTAGLHIYVGRYSIRVEDCSHFVFQEYGGDISAPSVDADADSVEDMMRDSRLVSDALSRAEIRHRFEIYNEHNQLSGYLHYEWPLQRDRRAMRCTEWRPAGHLTSRPSQKGRHR